MSNQKVKTSPPLTIYYSYACRDTYLLFRLLRQVREQGELLELTWRPFAIEMNGDPRCWERPWDEARSELRGFIAAASARRQGDDAFRSFHEALEVSVHEQLLELGDESTLLGAAEQAGLDLERFKSGWRDRALVLEARRGHENAVREYGVFGTPTVIFPNEETLHIEPVENIPLDRALEVFRDIAGLGYEHPYISKLERITTDL